MSNIKKQHSASFKAQVARAAMKGDRTINELCQQFSVSAQQIYTWKKQAEDGLTALFADKRKKDNSEETLEKLHAKIGRLTVERDFLAKVLGR